MPQKMFSRGTCVRKGEIVVKIEFSNINDLFLKKKIYMEQILNLIQFNQSKIIIPH